MPDPSTPNPSDPRIPPSDSDQEKAQKKPIKLKPVGKPEPAPDEPAKQADSLTGVERLPEAEVKSNSDPQVSPENRPDPKPISSNFGPSGEAEEDPRRKNLKLRRIIIKDVEINPHIKPDAEPVPEAQPYEEPVEEPPPADLKAVMGEHAPVDAPPAPPPQAGKIPEPEEKTTETEPEEETRETGPEKAAKETPEEEPEKQPLSLVRKIFAVLAFGGVLTLTILLALAYFDPFGEGLAQIQPGTVPIPQSQTEPSPNSPIEENEAEFAGIPLNDSSPDIQGYLNTLKSQRLLLSEDPSGVFVGSVFIPEGAPINPQIELTLKEITSVDGEMVMIISTPEGPPVPIKLSASQ